MRRRTWMSNGLLPPASDGRGRGFHHGARKAANCRRVVARERGDAASAGAPGMRLCRARTGLDARRRCAAGDGMAGRGRVHSSKQDVKRPSRRSGSRTHCMGRSRICRARCRWSPQFFGALRCGSGSARGTAGRIAGDAMMFSADGRYAQFAGAGMRDAGDRRPSSLWRSRACHRIWPRAVRAGDTLQDVRGHGLRCLNDRASRIGPRTWMSKPRKSCGAWRDGRVIGQR